MHLRAHVCAYTYIHVNTYMHACMYAHTHKHTHMVRSTFELHGERSVYIAPRSCLHTYARKLAYLLTHTRTHTRTHAHTHTRTRAHTGACDMGSRAGDYGTATMDQIRHAPMASCCRLCCRKMPPRSWSWRRCSTTSTPSLLVIPSVRPRSLLVVGTPVSMCTCTSFDG